MSHIFLIFPIKLKFYSRKIKISAIFTIESNKPRKFLRIFSDNMPDFIEFPFYSSNILCFSKNCFPITWKSPIRIIHSVIKHISSFWIKIKLIRPSSIFISSHPKHHAYFISYLDIWNIWKTNFIIWSKIPSLMYSGSSWWIYRTRNTYQRIIIETRIERIIELWNMIHSCKISSIHS